MDTASSTRIRPLRQAEQHQLLEWAAGEGWNPGVHDADLFWQLDPEGYLGIECDGALAGGGAIIRHHARFGFMGLFIMRPEFRSRKLGTKLWYARRDRLLARLDAEATIGLDAVAAMVPFYARGGFVAQARHRRYEWKVPSRGLEVDAAVRPLAQIDFEDVLAFDQDCFPGPRPEYLRMWIHQPDAHALGIVRQDELRGFGVMRRCIVGWKVGPLFARSPEDALALLASLGARAEGMPVYLDAPENSQAAQQLCRSLDMREVFGCVRMYLGPVPALNVERIYSITTFEVG